MNKKELGTLIIDGTDDFYRVAKSILKEDADCQDAVQEAVSKAFAKIDTLREKKYAKTWFIRILLNECYRMLRQRKREAAYHEQISGEEIRQHQYSDLYQKIMSLEIEYRVPLVLYYLNQYTIKEIGSTRPLKVISPVIATSARTGVPVIAESIAVAMVTPAEGPSFGTAPSGMWI